MGATVTFSIELELGHGLVRYGSLDKLSDGRCEETAALERLLALCDDWGIELTFDVVGYLFRDERFDGTDTPHERGWFDPIPDADSDRAPLFYAPDLIDMIRIADASHEISTHTFSHVECATAASDVVDWELRTAAATHRSNGLDVPVSLVPPRHSRPPRDVLRDNGIDVVRVPQYRVPGARDPPTKLHRAYDVLSGTHPILEPQLRDGIVETYSTQHLSLGSMLLPMGQVAPHPAFRALPNVVRKRLHFRHLRSALDAAIERDSYVHFWSHLWDLANDVQFPQVERFLRYVGTRDGVDIQTMAELNRTVRTTD